MPTSRLDEAVNQYMDSQKRGERVYARETQHGSRFFQVLQDEMAWDETKSRSSPHLYEILTGTCNTYFDIEWKTAENDKSAEQQKIRRIADCVVDALEKDCNIEANSVQFVTASGKVGAQWKASWHVHINSHSACWEDARALGNWVKTRFSSMVPTWIHFVKVKT